MTSHGIFRTICSETREETYLYPPQNSVQALSKNPNFFYDFVAERNLIQKVAVL